MTRARTREDITEKISRIANLPTLSPIVSRMLAEIHNPDSTAAGISRVISADVSMSARVLRVANSALFGMSRRVGSIQDAVVLLGSRTIRAMVLSLTVFDIFPLDRVSQNFDRQSFWRHCIATGIFAKRIARKQGATREAQEEAFCIGLLHDLGKIVMEEYLHRDFHTSLTYARQQGVTFHQAEYDLLGYTHCNVAQWLTNGWTIPESIRNPILYHHSPNDSDEAAQATALCHVADWASYECGYTTHPDDTPPSLCETVSLSGVDLGSFSSFIDSVGNHIERECGEYEALFSAQAE